MTSAVTLPPALVFESEGGAEGTLSVVRTLGRRGVPVTLVTDDAASISARSRYCTRAVLRPGYSRPTPDNVAFLVDLARETGGRPVLFPTADPDLLLLSCARDALAPHARHFLAARETLHALADKRRFMSLARAKGLPVPATWAPEDRDAAIAASRAARYPVVLKPANPTSWMIAPVVCRVGDRKALIVHDAAELVATYDAIAPHSTDVLLQEYIPGPDESHYSLHAYFDRGSSPVACFTGRKIRVYPPHAGSGCFVESVHVEPMVRDGLEALRRLRYTGIAVINFKQDERTGDFLIHEINPRVSQWNLLATRSGVDVPFTAYADTAGVPYERPGRQRDGVRYVYLRRDLRAFAAYRRHGEWTWRRYLGSFRLPLVFQVLAADDMGVSIASLAQRARGRLRRLRRLRRRPARGAA